MQRDVRVWVRIIDHEFLDWGGAEGEEAQVVESSCEISPISDLANGSTRNDVEPGKRGSDCS